VTDHPPPPQLQPEEAMLFVVIVNVSETVPMVTIISILPKLVVDEIPVISIASPFIIEPVEEDKLPEFILY